MANMEVLSDQVYYLTSIAQQQQLNANDGGAEVGINELLKVDNSEPELILLFSWMGALAQHIAKYTAAYNKLYPAANVLIIRTDVMDLMFRPTFSLNARLKPAIDKIMTLCLNSAKHGRKPRILSHSFSNGGAYALLALAKAYHGTTGFNLPLNAMILDSGPGLGNYDRSVTAVMMSVPKQPAIFYPMLGMVHSALTTMAWANKARGVASVITTTYHELNEHKFISSSVPRAYIYSTTDRLVDWQDVEAHAHAAGKAGTKVAQMKLNGSAHVAHMRQDPQGYMNAVKACWEVATKVDH